MSKLSIAEALKKESTSSRPTREECPVATLLRGLDADDAAALTAAMDRDNPAQLSTPTILRALSATGVKPMKVGRMNAHRRGECTCADQDGGF